MAFLISLVLIFYILEKTKQSSERWPPSTSTRFDGHSGELSDIPAKLFIFMSSLRPGKSDFETVLPRHSTRGDDSLMSCPTVSAENSSRTNAPTENPENVESTGN